jgi:hypothetical protein
MVISPEEIRANNRKKKNKKIWYSKEWKTAIKKFKELHPFCKYCDRPTSTGHHTCLDDYCSSIEYYIKMLFEKGEPVCNSCHWKVHRGYHICPVCKKNLTKYEQCWDCISDEVKEKFEVKKILRNKLRRDLRRKTLLKYTKVNKSVNDRVPNVD